MSEHLEDQDWEVPIGFRQRSKLLIQEADGRWARDTLGPVRESVGALESLNRLARLAGAVLGGAEDDQRESVNSGGNWVCVKPEHWIFEGPGMAQGERIPGLIGWEYHGDPHQDLSGLEVVGEGPALVGGMTPQRWSATIDPGPKGNVIFNASTIFWAQGLSSPPGHTLPWTHWTRSHGPDDRVQGITHNLLRRAIKR